MLCQVRWLAVKLSSVSQPSRRGAALGRRGCGPLRCPAPLPAGWLMGRGPRGEEGGEGTPSSLLARSSGWHRSSSGSTPQQLPQFLVYPPAPPPKNQRVQAQASAQRLGPRLHPRRSAKLLGSDVFTLCSLLSRDSKCFRQSPLLCQRECSPFCVFSPPVLLKKKNSDKMNACGFRGPA